MRLLAILGASLAVCSVAGAGNPPAPATGAVVETGQAPCGTAARGSSLWIGVYGTGTLLELDTQSAQIETRMRIGPFACRIAAGRGAVWVTRDNSGAVVRLAPGSGARRIVRVGAGAFDVLLAAGSAWATSFETGKVARIDASSARLQRVFNVGGNPAGLAFCGGRVWVGHGREATWLTSIHPTTLRVRRVDVGATAPGWSACIDGLLWAITPDTLIRLDPGTGRVLSRLRIGETLADVALGPDGLVWVTDKQHSVIHRVEPTGRNVVSTFPAGPGAFALARAGDTMWVTSFAGSDVRSYTR
jgi:streptogramin lyase